MFESLGRIQNPFIRGLAAAVTASSVTTFAAAIGIGVTSSKDDSAYTTALYAALVGAGCGAAFGSIYPSQRHSQKTSQTLSNEQRSQSTDSNGWKDWRNFVVTRKVKESEEITSFYLQPEDKGEVPDFQPGQFLTIKLDIPGQTKPVIRTYSLSDYSKPCNYYRLSIKREPTPPGLDVMPGIASNFMHDQIHVDSVIPAKPPSGRFVLDVNQSLPAVLVSNGVGITPMISMAQAVTKLNPNRSVWFIHGARDGKYHAFRDEVNAIAAQNRNLMLHYAYSRPQPEDEGHYHSTGYADIALIQSLVKEEAEYFLCGSPQFLKSVREGLRDVGVPDHRVSFEMFTKVPAARIEPSAIAVNNGNLEEIEVVFAQSGKTVLWQTDADSVLELAEANDLNPSYSCRQGICGTCKCKLLEGEVEYFETPVAAIAEGSALICIAKPKPSKVIFDL
jgi:hypothetical protein